ncbi:tRNA pseudouridine(38-40) synthase TruA [Haloimpatiens sp. FM7330]|uniref:tRNA pseudouridine(38-40) synthase TruA n=1 Tax=Haloimpatiens sp. FM7330 TaxID=3298610 RepID=UPI0036314C68
MKNIRLTIEYDGTRYCGWQKQKNDLTIQQTLENAINKITKEENDVVGCSRTDSGVHAKGFVANFLTGSSVPGNKFKYAINSKLPNDIVIIKSQETSLDFHARYCSKGKRYVYTVSNREYPVALYRNYIYHFPKQLNVDKMKKAAKYIVGTHDFTAFKSQGSSVKTSIRKVFKLDIIKNNDMLQFSISGDGFLYNMVRIIVGTLLDVGINKIEPEYIQEIIELKDRTKAGRVVPATGLCLEEVFY